MMGIKIFGCATAVALLAQCSSTRSTPDKKALTRTEALQREIQAKDIHYNLQFDLDPTLDTYEGFTEIQFTSAKPFADMTLDIQSQKVHLFEVNGKSAPIPTTLAGSLTIPATHLAEQNLVKIKYTNVYDKTGVGFHKFLDPEDQQVYLNTDFQPYDAHRLFPCFDQPDMRASYTLVVTSPDDWKVIGNSPLEKTVEGPRPGTSIRTFRKTKPFSTYLVALMAGPFAEWKDRYKNIPLGIYTRKSVAKFMDASDFFSVTKSGFAFFESTFATPYPFEKYDQIFVPEFNAGAMENVGAVTFNEKRYVFKRKPTQIDHLKRALVTHHELAHMWFGNLVTMKWWNDLWLNESFATFMGTLSVSKMKRFSNAWEDFHMGTKKWAYWQDELTTTHPIVAPIEDTDQTFSHFDGITYGKGASAIRQLEFQLGSNVFEAGIRDYFQTQAWKNTTLQDFLHSLEKAAGKSLKEWSKEWLESSGLNNLEARWECGADGRITSFTLVQSPANQSGVLRSHKTQIAFYPSSGSKPELLATHYQGESTEVPAALGRVCPNWVYPNYGDFDYAKVILDAKSSEYLKDRISEIESSLDRSMVWSALWTLVRDQKLSAQKYLNLLLVHLSREKDLNISKMQIDQLSEILTRYISTTRESHLTLRTESVLKGIVIESLSKRQQDRSLIFFDALVKHAASADMLSALASLLGSRPYQDFRNIKLDQPRRWDILVRLASQNHLTIDQLARQEAARDPSDLGKKRLIEIEAARPDPVAKEKYWALFVSNKESLSLDSLGFGMAGFNQHHQIQVLTSYWDKYFDDLPEVFEKQGLTYASRFTRMLFPESDCTTARKSQVDRLTNAKTLPYPLNKALLEKGDELSRCLRIRQAL